MQTALAHTVGAIINCPLYRLFHCILYANMKLYRQMQTALAHTVGAIIIRQLYLLYTNMELNGQVQTVLAHTALAIINHPM